MPPFLGGHALEDMAAQSRGHDTQATHLDPFGVLGYDADSGLASPPAWAFRSARTARRESFTRFCSSTAMTLTSSLSPCLQMSETDLTKPSRSEEHTSELQSLRHLVCRLLLAK